MPFHLRDRPFAPSPVCSIAFSGGGHAGGEALDGVRNGDGVRKWRPKGGNRRNWNQVR